MNRNPARYSQNSRPWNVKHFFPPETRGGAAVTRMQESPSARSPGWHDDGQTRFSKVRTALIVSTERSSYRKLDRVQPNPFAKYALNWLVVVVALGLSSPLARAEEPVTPSLQLTAARRLESSLPARPSSTR